MTSDHQVGAKSIEHILNILLGEHVYQYSVQVSKAKGEIKLIQIPKHRLRFCITSGTKPLRNFPPGLRLESSTNFMPTWIVGVATTAEVPEVEHFTL